jgi:hypothetical protein
MCLRYVTPLITCIFFGTLILLKNNIIIKFQIHQVKEQTLIQILDLNFLLDAIQPIIKYIRNISRGDILKVK